MNDNLCWGFLHQQLLKLGDMKPAEEIVYCSRQKKKSFPFTFVISKSNLYKMHFALHYSRIVCRDPRFPWQCSPAALSLMLRTVSIFFRA